MKKKDRSDKLYLEDLLTAMNRIAEYIEGHNFDQFKQDYRTVDAIVRNFEIIGEASKNVSDVIKNQNPEIPWNEMYYLRNRVRERMAQSEGRRAKGEEQNKYY